MATNPSASRVGRHHNTYKSQRSALHQQQLPVNCGQLCNRLLEAKRSLRSLYLDIWSVAVNVRAMVQKIPLVHINVSRNRGRVSLAQVKCRLHEVEYLSRSSSGSTYNKPTLGVLVDAVHKLLRVLILAVIRHVLVGPVQHPLVLRIKVDWSLAVRLNKITYHALDCHRTA